MGKQQRYDLGIRLLSEPADRDRDVQELVEKFQAIDPDYIREVRVTKPKSPDASLGGYSVYILVNRDFVEPDDLEDYKYTLWARFCSMAAEFGFQLTDRNGNVADMLPPYYLQMTYYDDNKNRRTPDLDRLVIKVADEAPGSFDHARIAFLPDGDGAFYTVKIMFADLLNPKERGRVRLAFHLRFNLLAQRMGFVPVCATHDPF